MLFDLGRSLGERLIALATGTGGHNTGGVAWVWKAMAKIIQLPKPNRTACTCRRAGNKEDQFFVACLLASAIHAGRDDGTDRI